MPSKVTLEGKLMFPNDYLAAVEFRGRDVTLTVASVKVEELRMKGGAKEAKPVIKFQETPKKLVCNKTNADSIAQLYGTEASAWVGKRITLYPTKTQCGRETVDCIRVREKVSPAKTNTAPPVSAPPPDGMPSQDEGNHGEDEGAGAETGATLSGGALGQDNANMLIGELGRRLSTLRDGLKAFHPEQAAVIAGLPSTWPIEWIGDINTILGEMGMVFRL